VSKRIIILVCEICGKRFEAHAHRRLVHCQECAEDLRHKGLGPLQVKRRISSNLPHGSVQVKEICWEQAEKALFYYLERFRRFGVYDGINPFDLDRITDEDRQLANKIAARMSPKTWAPVVGDSIAQVGDWDLFNMSDLEWQNRKEIVHEVLSTLLRHSAIGIARLTKALHRKRPSLIPICDSVIQKALGVTAGNKADGIVACMDKFRTIGRKHISALHKLRELSKQLHAEMTALRILELLYWVQFGPFPPASQKD
jgi:hypothetical protein